MSGRRGARALAVALSIGLGFTVLTAAPRPARADAGLSIRSIALGFGYAVPTLASGLSIGIDSAYLINDEGSPRYLHVMSYVSGATDIGVGALFLAFYDHSSATGIVTGVGPILLGSGAILTGYLTKYPDDIVGGFARITPMPLPGGGGLVFSGRF